MSFGAIGNAGGAVDLDLAVASTLGSGLFISCVMTASVVLIRTVDIVDTTAFVRDIIAYILANLLVLLFLWNGQLAAWEAFLLIVLYVAYVAIACYTSRSVLLLFFSHLYPFSSSSSCHSSSSISLSCFWVPNTCEQVSLTNACRAGTCPVLSQQAESSSACHCESVFMTSSLYTVVSHMCRNQLNQGVWGHPHDSGMLHQHMGHLCPPSLLAPSTDFVCTDVTTCACTCNKFAALCDFIFFYGIYGFA